jgi:hypothetical protein
VWVVQLFLIVLLRPSLNLLAHRPHHKVGAAEQDLGHTGGAAKARFQDLTGSKIPGGSSNTQRNNTWLAVPPASQDTPSGAGTAIDQQATQHAACSPLSKHSLLRQLLHALHSFTCRRCSATPQNKNHPHATNVTRAQLHLQGLHVDVGRICKQVWEFAGL